MGNDEIKNIQAKKYFKDFTLNKASYRNANDELHEEVKLSFSIQNCQSTTKYSFTVNSVLENNQNQFLLSCDSKNINYNNEILFEETIIMKYFFEKEQKLDIIFSINNQSFLIKTTLGEIVGSRNNTYIYKLNNENTLFLIKAEKLEKNKSNIYLKFNFDIQPSYLLDYSIPKNKIFFIISNHNKLYSSESLSDRGEFQKIEIPINLLKPSFNIKFYDFKKTILLDKNYTPEEYQNNKNEKLDLSKKRIYTIINKSKIIEKYSFLDYLKSGVYLGLSIGIDFTGSNGHPLDEGSLHRIKEGYLNDYEKAIFACGNIIAYYDYDQLFPVYGFGAIIQNSNNNQANMCFPINFNLNDPNIYTIEGVINCYHQCLSNLTFSGPTYFSPIINQVITLIKLKSNNLQYQVLMILTDGIINDMNETVDALVEGSFLPLSVIIIGIGNANFGNMEYLDGDKYPLVSSQGKKGMRDIVQFVPFNQFANNPQRLAQEVLEEIPRQIEDYYMMNDLYPYNLKQ